MNRFLANVIGAANSAIAFIIIGAGTLVGLTRGPDGALLGFVVGFVVALLVCGLLALVIDMHNELVLIRKALTTQPEIRRVT